MRQLLLLVVLLAANAAAVAAVVVGRRLFARGGRYYTPRRATIFWSIWAVAVSAALVLIVVRLLAR